jgi:4-amino-4-deoxy-L-arabinose transferase-like glycosyltransferase
LIAGAVTTIAAFAVEPALRVLSDEANLVGTSKNLFASKTPTFTVSGKYYYQSYWDVDVAIDQRPTLFPFLVSLVHSALGYSYRNVFLFNCLTLPLFLLLAYRLAKALGGETFGIVASLLVIAHPIFLIAVRSGGFDFLAVFLTLLVLHRLLGFYREPSPIQMALLWVNLCLLAHARYESALFVVPILVLLLTQRMVSWQMLRPYAWVYALSPAWLSPRVWQALLRGSVPEQEPGTVTFGFENFVHNAREYFEPLWNFAGSYPAHSAPVIALGLAGAVFALYRRWRRTEAKNRHDSEAKFAVQVTAWIALQLAIVLSYVWGRAQYPSAARLFIPIDTFFAFSAAFLSVRVLGRWNRLMPILLAAALLILALPVASQARMMNRLTQTRENAVTWRFFERLNQKEILVVTDRPNHFTILGMGAMNFEAARRDSHLMTAWSRRLFQDVYVIQQVRLSTQEPFPGYDIWPERTLEPVLEFQNDADVLVRVSRLLR